MKKILLPVVLVAELYSVQAQFDDFWINFDDQTYLESIIIDTLNYPDNIWQVGHPQKPGFDYAASPPNAIVTDTLNPYPANNTYAFTIMDFVSYGYYYGLKLFDGLYFVQSDSLNDYGSMEFSPDNGNVWIDLINDTVYSSYIQWFSKPILTGNSYGWTYFSLVLADIGSLFNIQMGDTVLFRLTFTSDENPDNLGGLMYDNFFLTEFIEGISETRFKSFHSKIYPNPGSTDFTIDFENPKSEFYELAVYNSRSIKMITLENVSGKSVAVDASKLPAGICFYKLTNNNLKERSWGKFVRMN